MRLEAVVAATTPTIMIDGTMKERDRPVDPMYGDHHSLIIVRVVSKLNQLTLPILLPAYLSLIEQSVMLFDSPFENIC